MVSLGEPAIVALQVRDEALHPRERDLHLEGGEGVDVATASAGPTGPRDHGGSPPRAEHASANPRGARQRSPPGVPACSLLRRRRGGQPAQPLVDLVAPFAAVLVVLAVLPVAVFAGDAFLAAVLRAPRLAAGARPRFSASSSAARSRVIASTVSSLRSVALVVPSVTYAPNRPSLTTTGAPDTGSTPSSRSGAEAAARPRALGWA